MNLEVWGGFICRMCIVCEEWWNLVFVVWDNWCVKFRVVIWKLDICIGRSIFLVMVSLWFIVCCCLFLCLSCEMYCCCLEGWWWVFFCVVFLVCVLKLFWVICFRWNWVGDGGEFCCSCNNLVWFIFSIFSVF